MEKATKRKIVFQVVNWLLILVIFAGMFAISLSAGFAAIAFSIIGWAFGYHAKSLRLRKKFFDAILSSKEELLNGKTIRFNAVDDTVEVSIVDTPKKKALKAAETKE